MYKNRLYFSSYRLDYQPIRIEDAGKVLFAIRVGNILFIMKLRSRKKSQVLFLGILYVSDLFINLIFQSKLFKNENYLDGHDQTINLCNNNIKISYCPI